MWPRSNTEEYKALVESLVGDEYTVLGEYANDKTKIRMKHNVCGYDEWYITPAHFKDNTRCPVCFGNLKGTTETFKKEVYKLVGTDYTVLGTYVNNNTELDIKHKCGEIYPIIPARFKKGQQRCKTCLAKEKDEKFKQKVYDLVGGEYLPVTPFTKYNEPVEMLHSVCGETFPTTPHAFITGGVRCKICGAYTTERFKKDVYALVGDEYTVLGEYVNTDTLIAMRHNTCGKDLDYITPHSFKQGVRCKDCRLVERTFTQEQFEKQVYDLVGDEYTVLGKYVNASVSIKMMHNTCGHDYPVLPHHFTSRMHRCPKCSKIKGYSDDEKEIIEFIKSFYTGTIIENDRTILNGKELDIYLPEKNIAIEFDGLYWHSEKMLSDKNYHLNKTIACKQKGIQLIHVFEDEWNFKQDIVKSKLKHILGCSKELPKIRASKCFIAELNASDKNQFLNENHIQGEDKANVKLGLWYPINDEENRLVAVMTFCKPRFTKKGKYDYELSRFATDIEFQVYGAFDKLFGYFKENYEWKSIITYADRRWSKGGLYESTGFVLDDISKPGYSYTDFVTRETRFNFQKHKLKKLFPEIYDDNLTEFQIMDKTKYCRIWDCGNYDYKYER